MPSLKVSVEAKQDLHGYDYPWVGGAGKNKLPYFTVTERNGIRLTYDNGVVILNGTASANTFFILTNLNLASGTYTFSANNTEVNSDVHIALRGIDATSDFTDLPMNSLNKSNTYQNVSIGQVTLYVFSGTQLTNFRLPLQIEVGNQATSFAPYSNICPISGWDEANVSDVDDVENPTVTQTTTISLPQTVYGGELDVVNGVLKITDGYIASYNGETLPSTWISSMDEYAEGTSPTTGAEVCYELANPIIINLTPTLIKSLNGQNNLSVDCGEVLEGEYFIELGGE
jgi:hypothetical protein